MILQETIGSFAQEDRLTQRLGQIPTFSVRVARVAIMFSTHVSVVIWTGGVRLG